MLTAVEESVRERIAALDVDALALLLRRRHVARTDAPEDLDELARHLVGGDSFADVYLTLPRPAVEVLSAVALCKQLRMPATVDAVRRLLGDPESGFEAVVEDLAELQIAWVSDGVLTAVHPLPVYAVRSYGTDVRRSLDAAALPVLRSVSTKLGLRGDGARPEVMEQLVSLFDDPDALRSVVESAPDAEKEFLYEAARRDSILYADPVYLTAARSGAWAVQRGLAWQVANGPVSMPVQVTRALLGAYFVLPFSPTPPEVDSEPVDAGHVEAEASARVLRMVELVTGVIESASTTPIQLLKSNAVGVRTVRAMAKDLHGEVDAVQMALELALGDRLLDFEALPAPKGRRHAPASHVLVATDRSVQWLASDPGTQAASLLQTWWNADAVYLAEYEGVADESRQIPPRLLRRAVVSAHELVQAGHAFADDGAVVTMLGWTFPCFPVEEGLDILQMTQREAELVGARALGAGTELGRALLSENVFDAVERAVSTAHMRATVGADLTAVVFGPPGTTLAHFFDSVAVREATGAATTWRFDQASVREAFDDGLSVTEVLEGLDRFSTGGIPQALTYLVNDVARTHGSIGAYTLACAVVAPDEALISEITANRRLSKLGPVVLAPTVVGFTAPIEASLEALRSAGYAPVHRDSDGQVIIGRTQVAPNAEPAPSYALGTAPSYDELAEALASAGD
ncbi:helicase-associated domain-containing protein [Rhodococcoides fascians]|uniref:helicase-associated domain-containing protein n=1 Tax=Rhodococcoides fascians TaxID=1828 RepID=UPI0005645739|nr:helicase-associated domain-containing protein [Rhodococcus fascians]